MSEPINDRIVIPAVGSYKLSNGVTGELRVSAGTLKYHERPKSTKNPIGRDGWRKPAPYFHNSGSFKAETPPIVTVPTGSNPNGLKTTLSGPRVGLHTPAYPDFWDKCKPDHGRTENEAIIKALNRLRDQEINVSVSFAEARESYRTVNHRLTSIARSIRNFRRRRPGDFNRARRCQGRSPGSGGCRSRRESVSRGRYNEVPQAWLELQYGWIPLMRDIQGAINEFARDKSPLLVTGRGTGTRDWQETWRVATKATAAAVRSNVSSDRTFPVRFRQDSYATLYYELVDPDKRSAGQLGLVSPDEVVWELLPYSFIVDWALPVGPWLSALHADRGLKFKAGSLATVLRGAEMSAANPAFTKGGFPLGSFSPRVDIKSFNRKVYGASPVPGLYVKNPLSVLHTLNGLALLTQAFR